MSSIKKVNLEEVSIFIRNGTTIKQDKNKQLGCPITRIETISKGIINFSAVGYANVNAEDYTNWLLKKGDILISHINSEKHLGKVAIYDSDEKLIHGMNLLNFRATDKIVPKYLYYFFNTSIYKLQIYKIMKKSVNQASFSLSGFRKIEIPLPPLPKQKAIAKKLDLAQKLIDLRKQSITKLDDLAKSVFVEMFGDPVENEMGWEVIVLGDVISSAKDGPHESPKYSEKGIPFLSARHVRPNSIIWNDLKYIDIELAKRYWKKCKPEIGDILYSKGGTTGFAASVQTDIDFAIWVHIALLKPKHDKVHYIWLENMLNTNYCYGQSQHLTKGIANKDLGLKRMVKINMYLPPLTLQNKFAKTIQAIEAQKALYQQELVKLEESFSGLLQESFA